LYSPVICMDCVNTVISLIDKLWFKLSSTFKDRIMYERNKKGLRAND